MIIIIKQFIDSNYNKYGISVALAIYILGSITSLEHKVLKLNWQKKRKKKEKKKTKFKSFCDSMLL